MSPARVGDSLSKHVLVTGASGFVGSAVSRRFREDGWEVSAPNEAEVDVRDAESLRKACQNVSVIVHAAGLAHGKAGRVAANRAFRAVNVLGTKNAVAAAHEAGVKRVVLVSSVGVYGHSTPRQGLSAAAPCHPRGAYARSKYLAEVLARRTLARSKTQLCTLRLATVYGPEDPGNMARLIRLVDRRGPKMVGPGLNLKTFVHVEDVARACALAAAARSLEGTYNVVGDVVALADLLGEISRLLGQQRPVRQVLPASVARWASALPLAVMSGFTDSSRWIASLRTLLANNVYTGSLIEEDLGFQAHVTLRAGLAEEVRWYREAIATPSHPHES